MPNDKEKVIRHFLNSGQHTKLILNALETEPRLGWKELAALLQESIERDKQLAKLEAEVKAMRDAMPRWISVDERLPKDKGYMLVFDGDTEYYNLAMFADDIGWTEIGTHIRLKEVDHWMPLPEPPTGGATGGEQIPYVAIGNGEPVPPQLKPIMEKLNASQEVPSVRDDPEVERERELDRQMKLHDVYPTIVCKPCGLAALALPENAHKKQMKVSTWYSLLCECCGKKKSCTESRDFGYPDFRNVKNNERKEQ